MVANLPGASFGKKGILSVYFGSLESGASCGEGSQPRPGVIITFMCVRERGLCRSNGSIFHKRTIVLGMAFIHYSFNFKWSFVDTFLGSRPDPCLWTRDIYHSPLCSNTTTWLSSFHIGNLAALKRCPVFGSPANGESLFMSCHLSRQPIMSVHCMVTSPHHMDAGPSSSQQCPHSRILE